MTVNCNPNYTSNTTRMDHLKTEVWCHLNNPAGEKDPAFIE